MKLRFAYNGSFDFHATVPFKDKMEKFETYVTNELRDHLDFILKNQGYISVHHRIPNERFDAVLTSMVPELLDNLADSGIKMNFRMDFPKEA